ncbi:zinc finger, CCHC-type containing protein [Tanacetum coccineum]
MRSSLGSWSSISKFSRIGLALFRLLCYLIIDFMADMCPSICSFVRGGVPSRSSCHSELPPLIIILHDSLQEIWKQVTAFSPTTFVAEEKSLNDKNWSNVAPILTQFDLTPHMQSQHWADINAGIQQHLQKLYNTNKASLKAAHWVINPETGTYDVETIRQGRPESITPADWDAQIAFWNDPRNQARAAQNRQNRAKSTVVCRQGSRSLARLRDEMMASSETREYPSLIDTFFVTHTVNGVFIRDEDRAIYEEMVRLRALGSNTESGVPYTDEEINALARKGKQRGHLPGVGRVLPGRATDVLSPPPPQCTHNSADVEKLKKKNKYLTKQVNLMMKLFRSDDKFSQMLTQYESTPEFGNASGSGGCGDDEMADDEDGGEDEEDEEDGDS